MIKTTALDRRAILGLLFLPILIWNKMASADFLSVSENISCALLSDQTARCWGSIASRFVTSPGFSHLTTGILHACGLRRDYSVSCWNSNNIGQAGNKNDCGQLTPPPYEFSSISAGANSTCGIKRNDSTLVCWGMKVGPGGNSFGLASPPQGTFTQVSMSRCGHACAIRTDGTVQCWGNNWEPWENQEWRGQATPPADIQFKQISAGCVHTCGIIDSSSSDDGTVKCWGSNMLWENTLCNQSVPPPDKFIQVSNGTGYSCGIKASDHSIKCWGCTLDGQTTHPGQFVEVHTASVHFCGLKVDGTLQCWKWEGAQQPDGFDPYTIPEDIQGNIMLNKPSPVDPSYLEQGLPYAQFHFYPNNNSHFYPPSSNIDFGIAFSGLDSTDSDGCLTDHEWDVNPKQDVRGVEVYNAYGNATTTMTFHAPGLYTVSLTVTDDENHETTASGVIELFSLEELAGATTASTVVTPEVQSAIQEPIRSETFDLSKVKSRIDKLHSSRQN